MKKLFKYLCTALLACLMFTSPLDAQEVKTVVRLKMHKATQLYRLGDEDQSSRLVNETIEIMLNEVRSGDVEPWMKEGLNLAMRATMRPAGEIEKVMKEVDLQLSIKKTADVIKLINNPPKPPERISGSELHQHLRNLDNSRATKEFLRARHRAVGYRPIITWFPQGTSMSVGSVIVSPDRRYVRIGVSMTQSGITGVNTFNFSGGR